MASILIKDTTREQREQIVRESLGDDYDVGCGYESSFESHKKIIEENLYTCFMKVSFHL